MTTLPTFKQEDCDEGTFPSSRVSKNDILEEKNIPSPLPVVEPRVNQPVA